MNKLWKIFQYGYLILAIACLIEGILKWSFNKEKSYFLIGFSIFFTLMFFFRRYFRKKIEKINNQKQL